MSIKNIIKKIIFAMNMFGQPAAAYCAHHGLLPLVLVHTPAAKLRKLLLLPESQYETQLNQDIFALIANQFSPGFFVEIGANDGLTLSNTVYLEEHFGWTGLLVEANPRYTDSLKRRDSKSIMAAVVEQEGYYQFCNADLYGGILKYLDKTHEKYTEHADTIRVWGTTLERILKENNAPELINFISVDVEGAEVPIVEQICRLQSYRFVCGCIEHNSRQTDYEKMKNILEQAGYSVIWPKQTQHDLFFIDGQRLKTHL